MAGLTPRELAAVDELAAAHRDLVHAEATGDPVEVSMALARVDVAWKRLAGARGRAPVVFRWQVGLPPQE